MEAGSEALLSRRSKSSGALCYIPFLGWIVSLFFVLTEKEDRFIRFNAIQSLLLLIAYLLITLFLNQLSALLSPYAALSWPLRILLPSIYGALLLLLAYKSYTGEQVLVPWIGRMAEAQTG